MKRHLLTITLIAAAACAGSAFASAPAKTLELQLEPGEGWWGGGFDFGGAMPITAKSPRFELDQRNGRGNAALFVSDRGRWVWSEDPCYWTFENGRMTVVPSRAEVRWGKAGDTLKSACDYASRTFQPPSGKMPIKEFFSLPGYCTWIELGYHQSQAGVEKYVRDMKANGFPPGVLVIDDTWEMDYGFWDFDARVFPEPKKMCDDLHAQGFKVVLWACAFISPDSREFRELQEKKGIIMAADGSLDFEGNPNAVLYNWWSGWSGVVDFSSPYGLDWMTRRFDSLCSRYGIDGFKFDATNPRYFKVAGGASHDPNALPSDLSHAYGVWSERYPMPSCQCWRTGGRAIVVRLMDKGHSWKELYRLVTDMSVAGLIGYPFILPDMVGGGLLKTFGPGNALDQELFVRSAQCQALSPIIQFSAAPWRVLDKEHLAAVRKAVDLRQTFAERFVALAANAGKTGEPILRSLEYVFPHRGYAEVKDEFLMGDDLLVAPQLTPGTSRKAVIPPGVWKGDDGSVVTGPCEVTLTVPLDRIPHFLRQKEAK